MKKNSSKAKKVEAALDRRAPAKYVKLALPQTGKKVYVPVYFGRAFYDRAQPTATKAIEEHAKIEKEVWEQVEKAATEQAPDNEAVFHGGGITQTPPETTTLDIQDGVLGAE